jgi:GntR family transcriptional regulator
MINIDSGSSKSIYEQVYDEFVKLISNKVLKPGEQLPSVRDLASMLRINPNTIQKAYKLLETREFIYSVPGKGNFVGSTENIVIAEMDMEFSKLKKVTERLIFLGAKKETIISAVNEAAEGVEINAGT